MKEKKGKFGLFTKDKHGHVQRLYYEDERTRDKWYNAYKRNIGFVKVKKIN